MAKTDSITPLRFSPLSTNHNFKDITGSVFGRLTVLGYAGSLDAAARWHCQCACGVNVIVLADKLRRGETKSCGCYRRDLAEGMRRTHGQTGQSIYRIWSAMRSRCKPEAADYACYGARGITVCSGWQSFEGFYADMGNTYRKGLSIDRIDNAQGYHCGKCHECLTNYWSANCRWATQKEQMRNTRNNVLLTMDGITHCLAEWAEITGFTAGTLNDRRKRGWTDIDILTTPLHIHKTST